MKKIVTALLTLSMMMTIMTNVVFAANTAAPIPWTDDIRDIPFSQGTDRNGESGWNYYKQGEGLVRNRWVQNYKYDWYYCGEDGFLIKSTWLHDSSDGKYYYLGDDWVLLHDTTTPDGYTVGSDGAWVKDGQVVVEAVADTSTKN